MKEYNFKINGNEYNVAIENVGETTAEVTVNGAHYDVEFEGMGKPRIAKPAQVEPMPGAQPAVIPAVPKAPAEAAPASAVKSPLPGVIIDIKVSVGDRVQVGQHLLILEAMKMENNIDSDREGVVHSIKVNRGDSVLEGDVLFMIE